MFTVFLSLSMFQILECVTINLTFVYALFAHAHIKQTNLCTILVRNCIIRLSFLCDIHVHTTIRYDRVLNIERGPCMSMFAASVFVGLCQASNKTPSFIAFF